jgi:hypothetical protein
MERQWISISIIVGNYSFATCRLDIILPIFTKGTAHLYTPTISCLVPEVCCIIPP